MPSELGDKQNLFFWYKKFGPFYTQFHPSLFIVALIYLRRFRGSPVCKNNQPLLDSDPDPFDPRLASSSFLVLSSALTLAMQMQEDEDGLVTFDKGFNDVYKELYPEERMLTQGDWDAMHIHFFLSIDCRGWVSRKEYVGVVEELLEVYHQGDNSLQGFMDDLIKIPGACEKENQLGD